MKRRVVITGIGAVTPVGNDVETMWAHMLQGANGIAPITHFDTSQSKVKIAGEVKNLNLENYVDSRQASRLDRSILLGLVAATQAYQNSGLSQASVDAYRFGTFVTSGIGGLNTIWQESQTAVQKGGDRISPFFIPNAIINLIGGHIAIKFQAKGPNLPVVTACSAATNSIGEAFRQIAHGYLDLAFAGGAEAPINTLGVSGFAVMKALNFSNDPDLASRPFDAERSGFVIAEGAGVLILEELKHARRRNAPILAEIVGYGTTSDAYHITAPDDTAEGVTQCLKMAIQDANIEPTQIDYINAHGTSTPLNDKIETLGIKNALGQSAYDVNISSTKSMTGHMLGATGAVESIVCIQTLRHGVIPPTIHYQHPDPLCDLNYTPNLAVRRTCRYAMNINVGFGGQNAALIFKAWEGTYDKR